MGSARIDHQVGIERADRPIITRTDYDATAVAMRSSSDAESSHLRTLEEVDIAQSSAELEYRRFDQWAACIELPQSRVAASRPSVRQPRGNIPARFDRDRSGIKHFSLESRKQR